jgi:RNA polymerase sigma factor (sigma-70 family)
MRHVVPMLAEATIVPESRSESPFEAMVREHWDAVYRLLHSLCRNVHDTEDLSQETFLRAWKRIESFAPGTKMRSWLLKIASNAFLDEQRRRKRTRSQPLEEELPGALAEPGHSLDVAQQAAAIREAMKDLSELTRMVFHLRATEDLSFREIAEVAGTTEQAARWHMHHARTKILERLGNSE